MEMAVGFSEEDLQVVRQYWRSINHLVCTYPMSWRNDLCKLLGCWLFMRSDNIPDSDAIIILLTRPTNEPPTTIIFRRVLATILICIEGFNIKMNPLNFLRQ